MAMRDPLAVVWLVASGVLIGVLLSLAAVGTAPSVTASLDAGVDAHGSMLAGPEGDRVVRVVAEHCTPESGWPCEPSR